jgi:hypothetical protein
MAVAHRAAGLTLLADRNVDGLPRLDVAPQPDITVVTTGPPTWAARGFVLCYSDRPTEGASAPYVRVARNEAGLSFEYADGTRFWVDRRGCTIWMAWDAAFEDACTYLVGPVLGLVLRLRGEFAIHASGIQAGGAALAIVGPHGSGKSTTAAAFGRRGYPVLTDDILRLTPADGGWWAHPFGDILRLWPDGAQVACGPACAPLPRITASWDKRALAIGPDGVPAAEGVLPLGGIVFLGGAPTGSALRLSSVSPADAVIRLAANSTAGYLLDTAMRAREFAAVTSIAAAVPCAETARSADPLPIDPLLDRMVEWFQAIRAGIPIV